MRAWKSRSTPSQTRSLLTPGVPAARRRLHTRAALLLVGLTLTSPMMAGCAANDAALPSELVDASSSPRTPESGASADDAQDVNASVDDALTQSDASLDDIASPPPGDGDVFDAALEATAAIHASMSDGASVPAHAADAAVNERDARAQGDAELASLDASAPQDAATSGDAEPQPSRPWPGGETVSVVDEQGAFAGNLSGLFDDPTASGVVLWGIQNDPSTLYRLVGEGQVWVMDHADAWQVGKRLHYPDGSGEPDAEGLTRAEAGSSAMYVSAERDNRNKTVSRLSVLRYDVSAPGDVLTASDEWNLTADLPAVSANDGLEAITWVPDAALVARRFVDESTSLPYAPADYPNHGGGLFLVGLEANGGVYAYALDQPGPGYHRIATIATGQPAVMDLWFDREVGQLWAYCDDTCNNRATLLGVAGAAGPGVAGRFAVRATYDRPAGMSNLNNEGITMASESSCVGGQKSFLWADDSATAGHSIRQGTVSCGLLP